MAFLAAENKNRQPEYLPLEDLNVGTEVSLNKVCLFNKQITGTYFHGYLIFRFFQLYKEREIKFQHVNLVPIEKVKSQKKKLSASNNNNTYRMCNESTRSINWSYW